MSAGWSESSLEEWEQDRQDLRAELLPHTQITSLRAAWLLGRFLNELRFHLEVTWILSRDNEPIRTTQLWTDSAVLIQRLLNGRGDGAIVEFERARSNWERLFKSEWHSEEIAAANECLLRHLRHGEQLPDGDSEVDYLARVCRTPTESTRQMCEGIAAALPAAYRSAFRLGQIADQLIHPPLNSRIVRIGRPMAGGSSWLGTSLNVPSSGERALIPPNQLTLPWPNSDWLRSCTHHHADFCRQLEDRQISRPLNWADGAPLSRILDDLTACVPDAESDSIEAATGLTRQGQQLLQRLRLTLDHSTKEVNSEYVQVPTRLSPRLYRLFLHFLNSGEECTPTRWIGENWSLFCPGSSTLSDASVHTSISQLNNLLNGHQVSISSDGGYKLIRTGRTT